MLQISNWKRLCLRGSKGLLKLFPSTNPVMNSMSSSSSTQEISKLNMESNKDSKSSSKMVRARFFWFCFHVIGFLRVTNMPIVVQFLSQRCPSVFRAMKSLNVPQSNPCWRAHWRPNLQPHTSGWSQYESPRVYTWKHGIAWPLGCFLEVAKWIALGYTGSYWVI